MTYGKKKLKICYVISSLSNQGPPNVLYNIIQYMDFEKFDVSIITMVEEQKISRIDEFRALPVKVIQMHPKGIQNPLKMLMTLKKTVVKVNPDIVHAHCPRSLMLIPFLPKKYKKVETVHIYPGIQQKVMYGKIKGQIVIWLSHFFTKRMDLPIACSESVAQSYWSEHHFKMIAIPNGCSMPVEKINREEKENLKTALGLKSDLRYFIFVGRFSKEKNPDVIVKAFNLIKDTIHDIGLVMLGDGDMYDEIAANASDRLLTPGFKENVYDYIRVCDYYISASDVEGLANTFLEAMAVGLPSVVSNIPAHLEVFKKASQTIGFVFDNKDLRSFVSAINGVLNINYEKTSKYIQSLFEMYYTAKTMSERYQHEYVKLMEDYEQKISNR